MSLAIALVVASSTGERGVEVAKLVGWFVLLGALLCGAFLVFAAGFAVLEKIFDYVGNNPLTSLAAWFFGLALVAIGYIAAATSIMVVGGLISGSITLIYILNE